MLAVAGLLQATGQTAEALAEYRKSEALLAGLESTHRARGRGRGMPITVGGSPVPHGEE